MAHDVILFAIAFDEIYKLLGIGLFDLSLADALDVFQFLQRHRIVSSHLFNTHILEDDVWRTLQPFRDFLAQVSQHGAEHWVKGIRSTIMVLHAIVIVIELIVLDNHERAGILQELLAG